MIVRYEDIMTQRAAALYRFADRLGIARSDLDKGFDVAGQETRPDGKFFWKQKAGHYQEALPFEMTHRFQNMYSAELEVFGYSVD